MKPPPPPRTAMKKWLASGSGWGYLSSMTSGPVTALERLLRPFSQHLTLELVWALLSVQADVETQARYDELAGKRTESQLNPTELAELESIVRANTLLGVLKTEAHAFLGQASHPFAGPSKTYRTD